MEAPLSGNPVVNMLAYLLSEIYFLERLPFFKCDVIHGTDHGVQALLLFRGRIKRIQTANKSCHVNRPSPAIITVRHKHQQKRNRIDIWAFIPKALTECTKSLLIPLTQQIVCSL